MTATLEACKTNFRSKNKSTCETQHKSQTLDIIQAMNQWRKSKWVYYVTNHTKKTQKMSQNMEEETIIVFPAKGSECWPFIDHQRQNHLLFLSKIGETLEPMQHGKVKGNTRNGDLEQNLYIPITLWVILKKILWILGVSMVIRQ